MACGKFGCQMSTAGTCGDPYCPMKGVPLPGSYQPMQPMFSPPPPMGCVCPPTSERTCESPCCPRQNPFKRPGSIGTSGAVTQSSGEANNCEQDEGA